MSDIVLLSNSSFKDVINLPIFDIEYLNLEIDISKYNALIFTSKNAIYSLLNSTLQWKDIESYAIAPKTAEILKKHQANLVFTGVHSHGNEFAFELIPLLKNKKVLYVRGKKTVSKLFETLKENKIDVKELISYKTICSKNEAIELKENSIIIFTSPSSVNYFLKKYSWNDSFKAIAIGNTTASYLPKNIQCHISSIQSIEACISLAKQISKN